ncbi:MAG: hypothetical protein ABSB81_08720 [Halobacteriota archaeon]|jgi:hypothetical protein
MDKKITFGTFLWSGFNRQHTPFAQAINFQIGAGDKKQALYDLFAAYVHTVALEQLIECVERVRRDAQQMGRR